MNSKLRILTLIFVLAAPLPASAEFWGAEVKNVPAGDHLNVRKTASPSAQVLAVYNNGDALAFTGYCENSKTHKSFNVEDILTQVQRYNRMKASNVWCQIWLETPAGSGKYDFGWVKGKFLWPS